MRLGLMLRALALVLISTGTTYAAPAPKTLRAFVQRLLVVAPTDFSSARGARKGGGNYYASYTVLARFGACTRCKLTDEYSWTGHKESWAIENEWHGAKGSSQAKLIRYVSSQLAPVLATFSLKKTGPADDPTFIWSDKKNRWVFVHIYNGGFTVRVGHDLVKPVHVLLAPTTQQLAELRAGVSNFVASGVAAATSNFASLRATGKKGLMGIEHGLLVPFGPMLVKCSITDASLNTLNIDDYSPKWTMNCQTPPMLGTKARLEEPIRAAMQAALPAGYTPTTDKSLLFFNDYRWDNTDSQVAVDIDSFGSYNLPDGLIQLNVGVIHFLPKSAPSTGGTPR